MTNIYDQFSKLSITSVDIEGDGNQPPNIVEISTVKIADMKISDQKTWLLNPGRSIASHATKVHGIRNSDVASAPHLSEVASEIESMITGVYLLAHNASVEFGVLKNQFPNWNPVGVIDTLKLARLLTPELPSHKLTSLIAYFDIDHRVSLKTTTGPHRAFYDSLATFYLFQTLLSEAHAQGLSMDKILVVPAPTNNSTDAQMELF